MPSFYARADAFVVSLKQDPVFSMTLPGKELFYLMAGVPLLGMLEVKGSQVIADANAGLVCPPGDGAGLAAAVRVRWPPKTGQEESLKLNPKNDSNHVQEKPTEIQSRIQSPGRAGST